MLRLKVVPLISMYGKYIDGKTLHPPESAYPCACDRCHSIFFSEYGKSIEEADTETARQFFIKTYLEFQCNSLFPLIKKMLPDCSKMMFTVPWLFESSLLSISPFISKELTIIEWDYNLDPKRIYTLTDRLHSYMQWGNNVWFMPTAGFSFNDIESIDDQIEGVHLQLQIAEDAGVEGVIHFLGPKTSDFMVPTSRKFFLDSKTHLGLKC